MAVLNRQNLKHIGECHILGHLVCPSIDRPGSPRLRSKRTRARLHTSRLERSANEAELLCEGIAQEVVREFLAGGRYYALDIHSLEG